VPRNGLAGLWRRLSDVREGKRQANEGSSMDAHATNVASRNPSNGGTSPYVVVAPSCGRFLHPRRNERTNTGRSLSYSRTDFRSPDPLVKISPSGAVARRALSWPGMAVEMTEATQPCQIEVRFCAPVHLLVLFEEGVRRNGLTCVEGLSRSRLQNLKGKLVFVPAGHEYYDRQEPSRLSRAAYFYFDPAVLPCKSEAGHASVSLAPRLLFEDAGVWNIASRLKALIEQPGPVDPLYCESLGVVLAHELVGLGSGGARVGPTVRGGLAGWQQRVVASYIEEHVADEIPLATMAQLARLSLYHFSRAFKQTFRTPPHQFHMHRRIERAKSLLRNPALSITSIGMAVGFSDPSAFSTAFRKATGMTPSGFQRSA
jgi:AraC family transcriptional regulator